MMANNFNEFSKSSKEDWLKQVEKDLKGKPIDDLNWNFDGMDFSPFYHSEDNPNIAQINTSESIQNSWEISESIRDKNPKEANRKALEALNGGCTALTFIVDKEIVFDFGKVLKGIQLELIFTEFVLKGVDSLVFTEKFLIYVEGQGFDTEKIRGALYEEKPVKDMDILDVRRGLFPNMKMIKIASSLTSSTTEDLAKMLTKTKNHLKRHSDKKALGEAMIFQLSMDDFYFGNIAKIRAFRLLLQNLFHAYNISDYVPFISVTINTSDPNRGENSNIIRANTQSIAAVIGGVDLLKITFGLHTNGISFSNRIARNISHILDLESHLSRVKDPSAGSYFIETLTDSICEKAWKKFQ
ncbi:MAG: methylmalonyl-CoA mutase family protein [Saprospiraceae bacterium]